MPPHPWPQENLKNVHITFAAFLRPFLLGMISHLGYQIPNYRNACMFIPHYYFPTSNLLPSFPKTQLPDLGTSSALRSHATSLAFSNNWKSQTTAPRSTGTTARLACWLKSATFSRSPCSHAPLKKHTRIVCRAVPLHPGVGAGSTFFLSNLGYKVHRYSSLQISVARSSEYALLL